MVSRLITLGLAAGLMAACSAAAVPESVPSPGSGASAPHGDASASLWEPLPEPRLRARAGERIITVGVPPGFRPEAPTGATDEYRCFVADPSTDEASLITGAEFLPGNAAIVHHSILYAAHPDQVDAAQALDARDSRPGYECFGGSLLPPRGGQLSGLDDSDWLAAWAPGGGPSRMPQGYGVPLPAGGRIIVQMHYNLRGGAGDDATRVRLRITDKRLKPLRTSLLPAPVELPCAPGESGRLCDRTDAVDDVVSRFGAGSGATIAGLQLLCGGDPRDPRAGEVQTCDRPVTREARVFAVAGHMHLLGRQISVTLNPGADDERTLLDIPAWDFDRQAAVPLEKPVRIEPGDTLRVRCRHDAGLRRQLPALADAPARYVVWGEGTTDEMCLAIVLNG
jgi:hypothetical protein